MGRERKADFLSNAVTKKQHPLSKLRRAVVDGVDLERIETVRADSLQVVFPQPKDRPLLLIDPKGGATFIGAFGNRPMSNCG